MLGEPAGAVGAEGLLVGDSGKDERSFRPEAAAGEAVEGEEGVEGAETTSAAGGEQATDAGTEEG